MKGDGNIDPLLRLVRPSVVIPLRNADTAQSGPLSWILWNVGSSEQDAVQARLRSLGLANTRAVQPAPPGEPLELQL